MRLAGCWRTRFRLDLSGPAAARARHAGHIAGCARCRDAVLAAEAVEALLRDPAAEAAVPVRRRARPAVILGAAAAGLAAAVLLVVLAPWFGGSAPGVAPSPAPGAAVHTPRPPVPPEPRLEILDATRNGKPADLTVVELPSGDVVLFLR